MNEIIKELHRDFMGMLSKHTLSEVAELLNDWEICRFSNRQLTVSKVICGNQYRANLFKGDNIIDVNIKKSEVFC